MHKADQKQYEQMSWERHHRWRVDLKDCSISQHKTLEWNRTGSSEKTCKEHGAHTEPSHPLVLYWLRYQANSFHRSKLTICISDERHYNSLDSPRHLLRQDSLLPQLAYLFLPNNLQYCLQQKIVHFQFSYFERDAECADGVKAG